MSTKENTQWKKNELMSHPNRPNTIDYINSIFPDFIELKGDRLFGDDPSLIGGIASIGGIAVTIVGNVKGHNLDERIHTNFSMAKPEGYRKTIRLMKQAEKFKRPVICFVDTLGAYPGREAEERGQGSAIAHCIAQAINLNVPIISVLIGDGGSGGALALCVADYLIALEHAALSVISPKACASILWNDASRHTDAARMLKMDAVCLSDLGVVDIVVYEPGDGAHTDPHVTSKRIQESLYHSLTFLNSISIKRLVRLRKKKYSEIGNKYIRFK